MIWVIWLTGSTTALHLTGYPHDQMTNHWLINMFHSSLLEHQTVIDCCSTHIKPQYRRLIRSLTLLLHWRLTLVFGTQEQYKRVSARAITVDRLQTIKVFQQLSNTNALHQIRHKQQEQRMLCMLVKEAHSICALRAQNRTAPIDNNTNSKNRRTGWWAPFNVIHSLITAVRLLMNSFYVGFPVSSMLASACCTTKHIRCRRIQMSNFQLDTEDVASIDFTTHTALVFWFVVFRYTADVVDAVRSGPMVCAQHLNVATRLYWWWYWHSYAVDKHGFCAEFNWCFAYERCLYRKIGYTARMLRLFDLFAMQSAIFRYRRMHNVLITRNALNWMIH